MEKDKKRGIRRLLNIFDIAVILIAAAAVVFLYLRASAQKQEELPEHVEAVTDDSTVRYTVELSGLTKDETSYIKPGDAVREKTDKYDLGTVESVEISGDTMEWDDYDTLTVRRVPAEGKYVLHITVVGECVRGADGFYLDGKYPVYGGSEIEASFGTAMFKGHVISVERSDG